MKIEDIEKLRDEIMPSDTDPKALREALIARLGAEVYKLKQGEIEKVEPIYESGYVVWYLESDNTIICAPDMRITDLFSPLDDDIILGRNESKKYR